jgi:hypothetical protein
MNLIKKKNMEFAALIWKFVLEFNSANNPASYKNHGRSSR